jgi:hypothetical protein
MFDTNKTHNQTIWLLNVLLIFGPVMSCLEYEANIPDLEFLEDQTQESTVGQPTGSSQLG